MVRIEMEEVNRTKETFSRDTQQLVNALNDVQEKITKIKMMDSFKGRTADSVKGYLDDIHITSIIKLKNTLNDIDQAFKKDINIFEDNVDSQSSALLDQGNLRDYQGDMRKFFREAEDISENVKSIINSVDDLYCSHMPNFRPVDDSFNEIEKSYMRLHDDIDNYRARHLDNARDALAYLKKILGEHSGNPLSALGESNEDYFKKNPVVATMLLGKIDSKSKALGNLSADDIKELIDSLEGDGIENVIFRQFLTWPGIKKIRDILNDKKENDFDDNPDNGDTSIDKKELDAWVADFSAKVQETLKELEGMMPDAEGRKQMLEDIEKKINEIDENKTLKSILNAEQAAELLNDTRERISNANEDGEVSTEELEEIIIDLAVDFALIAITQKGNISNVTAEQIYNMPLDELGGLTVSEYVKEGIDDMLDSMQSDSED